MAGKRMAVNRMDVAQQEIGDLRAVRRIGGCAGKA